MTDDSNDIVRKLILEHAARYPKAQPADLVKLLYQGEFGGGHMIKDEDKARDFLLREWQDAPENQSPALENIGDYRRVNFCAAKARGLCAETAARMFLDSAKKAPPGGMQRFLNKLGVLRSLAENGKLPFYAEALELYLESYFENGCTHPSHSEVYRKAYRPAYRVISGEYGRFFEAFAEIDRRMAKAGRLIVALDGPACSGKSTLARLISGVYGCGIIRMDDFFLQTHQRTAARFKEPGGNVDYERFASDVLPFLKSDACFEGFRYPVFDCSLMRISGQAEVPPSKLIVVEGVYSMHPRFSDAYGLKIFLQTKKQTQLERLKARNPQLLDKFIGEWLPMEDEYFSNMRIREKSDIVIDT